MDVMHWTTYGGVTLWKAGDAYFYQTSRIEIDADGAPNAYHPDDTGLDKLSNAGYPNAGWRSVLVADPDNTDQPYVQTSGEFSGYFLSMTTLKDTSLPVTDPARYVDATTVPYVVFPGAFYKMAGTGDLGDLVAVMNRTNGDIAFAVVADIGPEHAQLGEVSIALAEALGGRNVNPRNGAGAPSGPFVYVVFPKTAVVGPSGSATWPASVEMASDMIDRLGGWDAIVASLSQPS